MTIHETRDRGRTAAQAAGEALAGRLFAAEAAIDAAVSETASLIAMLPEARAGLWLSAVTGQKAFDEAAASVGALARARGHLVATHHTLAALARRLGLEVLATGPIDKPEDGPPIGDGPTGFFTPAGSVPDTATLP